jgi:hypothetical protein
MKKGQRKPTDPQILSEYDFSKGVRGKNARQYAQGSNVVVLPPDLAKAFPTRQAVIDALHGLVSLAQKTARPSSQKSFSRRPASDR